MEDVADGRGRDGRWSEWEGRDTGWAGGEMGEGADAARMTDDDDGGDGMRGRGGPTKAVEGQGGAKITANGSGEGARAWGVKCTASECSIV